MFRRTDQRMIKSDDDDKVPLQADKSFRVRVSSFSQNKIDGWTKNHGCS